ncbi:MAG: TetR/AcrR family transcriptional regulator [Clostridiales bacterium]|nr:TetR/AcrR family transcriptional regulator [Clostridiales bacterium]
MNISKTQEKILEIGKKEFLDKGFKEASLNEIVEKAGFTKGAFYGYYPTKESLFDSLVFEVINEFNEKFKKAKDDHFNLILQNKASRTINLSTDYLKYFVNYVYDHFDVFKLILCCSNGTKYNNYIHNLVVQDIIWTEEFFKILKAKNKIRGNISKELHHMIISAYFTAAFETVVHDMKREEAIKYIEELATFFNAGWKSLITFI